MTLNPLRTLLVHLDQAVLSLQRAADIAYQDMQPALAQRIERKADELLALRAQGEMNLRQLEEQALEQTKGQP